MAYNPGVSNISGQLFARGLENAGASIAAAMEKRNEEIKTRARAMKGIQEVLDASGIATKAQTSVMSLEQAEGLLKGAVIQRAEQDRQRRIQADELQRKRGEAELLEVARRQRAAAGRQAFAADLTGQMEPPMVLSPENQANYQGRISNPGILAALGRNPDATLDMTSEDLLKTAQSLGQEQFTPGTVVDVPGMPGYAYGIQNRQGAGSFLPKAGTAAAKPLTPLQEEQKRLVAEKILDLQAKRKTAAGGAYESKEITDLRSEIAGLKGQVGAGDMFWGPDWAKGLGMLDDRATQLKAAETRLGSLTAAPAPMGGGGAAAAATKMTPETLAKARAIRARMDANELTPEEATNELRALGIWAQQ